MARKPQDTTPERLASIEARFDAFMNQQADRHIENQKDLQALQAAQMELQHTLARYTGFWGALLLVGAALGTILTFFGGIIRRKLGLD
jgi:hypothetical protein